MTSMDGFRAAVAVFVALAAVALGGYVGVVKVLVAGIAQVVAGIKADPTDAQAIAWGMAKVWLLWEVAWAAIAGAGIGVAALIWPSSRPRPTRRKRRLDF